MRPPTGIARSLSASLTICALVSTGCASALTGPTPTPGTWAQVDLSRPEMAEFPVAGMTDYERDVRLETSDKEENEKLTPALYWTGIALGTIGALGMVGFGIAGFVSKNELNNAYDDGLSPQDRSDLVDRGNLYNTLAITGATMTVLGYALALVTYGVDWNRCGPLVRNKRTCLDRKKKDKHQEAEPASEPVAEPASEPVAEPASEPASELAETPPVNKVPPPSLSLSRL